MGKGVKAKGKQGSSKKKGPADRQLTAQMLYEQAQFALQYDDFDAARTALKKAAKMEPMNVEIVDALGALLAEIGPPNEAVQVCKAATAQRRQRSAPCVHRNCDTHQPHYQRCVGMGV